MAPALAQRLALLLSVLGAAHGASLYANWMQLDMGSQQTVTASTSKLPVSQTLLPITTTGNAGVNVVRPPAAPAAPFCRPLPNRLGSPTRMLSTGGWAARTAPGPDARSTATIRMAPLPGSRAPAHRTACQPMVRCSP